MTRQEYEKLKATITAGETKAAELDQTASDQNKLAAKYNALRRQSHMEATEIREQLKPLIAVVQAYEVELKRLLSEKKAREAEEAKARHQQAAAAEQSELEKLRAENEQLKAAVAESAKE